MVENQNQEAQHEHPGFSEPPRIPPSTEISETEEIKKKHSKLGIASTILAAIAITLTIFTTVLLANTSFAQNLDLTNPNSPEFNELFLIENPEMPVIGLMVIFIGILAIIGFILGLVSLFYKNPKKIFPILGITFNALGPIITYFIVFSLVVAL